MHTETQKLSGNIFNTEEEIKSTDGTIKDDDQTNVNSEQIEVKKPIRRVKAKTTTFVLTDLSKITLEHEFEFRPLQPSHMCQWRGGVGSDSIYAEMVTTTMYSSSDYPLIDGFTNANIRIHEQQMSILDSTITTMIDLRSLRSVIKTKEGHDHILGRSFSFFVFDQN